MTTKELDFGFIPLKDYLSFAGCCFGTMLNVMYNALIWNDKKQGHDTSLPKTLFYNKGSIIHYKNVD